MTVLTAVAAAWLAGLTAVLPAEPVDPLQAAAVRLGAGRTTRLRLTGFGTAYVDARGRLDGRGADVARHAIARYAAVHDYRGGRADASMTLVAPSPRDADPEPDLLAWPHGFVKYARAYGASAHAVAQGVEVTFDAGRRRYTGLLTADGDVDRVRVSSRYGAVDGEREIRFREYDTSDEGVRYPRHVVESRDGRLVLDLWVAGVEADRIPVPGLASLRPEGRRIP